MAVVHGDHAFVGREQELSELTETLHAAISGSGQLVMLTGEPGIGKTRLAEELARAAADHARVLWARCPEQPGAPPYWPWVQLIRAYVAESDPDQLKRVLGHHGPVIGDLVPEVREAVSSLAPAPEITDSEQARFRLFDAISSFITRAAKDRPVLLILDDLHWADIGSLRLLEFFATGIPDTAVLVLGTYRDSELSRRHPLAEALGSIGVQHAFRRMTLRGLTVSGVGRLVTDVVGTDASTSVIQEIHHRTNGNPFFVSEVAREMVDDSGVQGYSNGTGGKPGHTFRIPEGVHEAIGRRLNRLSDRANEVLAIAAVIGRDFRVDTLEAVSEGSDTEEIIGALEEARETQIIEELSDDIGHYQFTHALIQESLTAELSLSRRVHLHAQIAQALERFYGEDAHNHASELAHHYTESEPVLGPEKSFDYARLAGDQALAAYGYEAALVHYERALEIRANKPLDDETVSVMVGSSRAQAALGWMQDAADNISRAIDFYFEAGDVARAATTLEMVVHAQIAVRLLDYYRQINTLVPKYSRQAGILLETYGRAVGLTKGTYKEAREAIDAALRIAERNDDASMKIRAFAALATVDGVHMRWESASQHANSVLASDVSNDTWDARVVAHLWAANSAVNLGQPDVALKHSLLMYEAAKGWRQVERMFVALAARVSADYARGDWVSTEQVADEMTAISEGRVKALIGHHLPKLLVVVQTGEISAVESALKGLRTAPEIDAHIVALGFALAGSFRGNSDYFATADDYKRRSHWEFSSPLNEFPLEFVNTLVSIHERDETHALKAYEILLPFQHTLLWPAGNLSCDRILGLLAEVLGKESAAAAHFEDALAFCRSSGYAPELAWSCVNYAELLLESSEQGSGNRVTGLLDEALAITGELHMRPLEDRITALKDRSASRHGAAQDYPDGLTHREVEVIQRIAAGKSNREIAGELHLSIRTIERHITNIYRKIGSGGRADATVYALHHGLSDLSQTGAHGDEVGV